MGRDSTLSRTDLVYLWCMSRTNIDIDDDLCQRVMDRFHLKTKREAVNLALRHLAGEPLRIEGQPHLESLQGIDDQHAERIERKHGASFSVTSCSCSA